MTNYAKLPTWADGDHVYAVVETPRGSRAKLEFDPQLGAFTLAKPLLAGLTYPYDWGFIPSTKAQDGDPLDVLIIHDAATYPGLVLKCKPIGVLEVVQSSKGKKERNDRVFVVPGRSPFEGDLQDIRRLPARAIEELERILRGDQRARIEEIAVSGLARTGQGHQDDKESRSLG
jgi:inorganic pyrophosphatase